MHILFMNVNGIWDWIFPKLHKRCFTVFLAVCGRDLFDDGILFIYLNGQVYSI